MISDFLLCEKALIICKEWHNMFITYKLYKCEIKLNLSCYNVFVLYKKCMKHTKLSHCVKIIYKKAFYNLDWILLG